jgi:hypothetical protein
MDMRSLLGLAGALALGFSTIAATAMPIDASLGETSPTVAHVAYGCGPGMTRGPYGHCRPRFTCPPGWHPGPHGWHCFRN